MGGKGVIPRGGKPRRQGIPEHARVALRQRLERHALGQWKDRCRAIDVRFRGSFAYVDAFEKNPWHLPDASQESRDLIDATPARLCRLGYLGSANRWSFAFYTYSNESYEPSVLPSGSFEGTPEEAFDCAAGVYLTG
jgi:hypothetical protein